jgi:hypothetical protein
VALVDGHSPALIGLTGSVVVRRSTAVCMHAWPEVQNAVLLGLTCKMSLQEWC